MDWMGPVVAAGYHKAGLVRFHAMNESGFRYQSQVQANERVWSVALNKDGSSCSIGSAGYHSTPLKIYDLHRLVWSGISPASVVQLVRSSSIVRVVTSSSPDWSEFFFNFPYHLWLSLSDYRGMAK